MYKPDTTLNVQVIPKIRIFPEDPVGSDPARTSTAAEVPPPPDLPGTDTMPGSFPNTSPSDSVALSVQSQQPTLDQTSDGSATSFSQTSISDRSSISGSGELLDGVLKPSREKKKKGDKKSKLDKAARQAAFREAHGGKAGGPKTVELLHEQVTREMLGSVSGHPVLSRKPTETSAMGGSSGCSTPLPGGEVPPSKPSKDAVSSGLTIVADSAEVPPHSHPDLTSLTVHCP